MKAVDVCIVATRRPELLRRTLQSFSENMLRHFQVARSIINIDPAFGDEDDLAACIAVVREYLPETEVLTPEVPGFCAAVKSNWSRTGSEFVIHLEDDWTLNTII